jgi:hypothetical protein
MPDGTVGYTRDGALKIDSEGRFVTASGYEMQPGIVLPQNTQSVSISRDGIVTAAVPGHRRAGAGRHAAARRLHQPGGPAAGRREPLSSRRPPAARRRSATRA